MGNSENFKKSTFPQKIRFARTHILNQRGRIREDPFQVAMKRETFYKPYLTLSGARRRAVLYAPRWTYGNLL